MKIPALLYLRETAVVVGSPSPFHPSVSGQKARGPFALWLATTANGRLEVSGESLAWRPGWLARRSALVRVECPWSDVVSVRIMAPALHRKNFLFVDVEGKGGRIALLVGDLDADALAEELGRYLVTAEESDPPSWFGPLKPA